MIALAVVGGGWVAAASTEPLKVRIESDDQMRFDVERFVVEPGREVELTLVHMGRMPVEVMGHNVVILADPGMNPISFGLRVQEEGGNLENEWMPEGVLDDVIAYTAMIGGGETTTVTFTAPERPGEYPYLCSFPMHAELMTGVMEVEGEVEASEAAVVDSDSFPSREDLAWDPDAVPEMADGFEAEIWVREPLLLHPSALAFDGQGRLFVGGGPQYRIPERDSPKDSVWVIVDDNGDGVADRVEEFATGLNSVQGLAWRNGELWVANAPDVTVLRDTTGDLRADEFVKVYTHLGHLRHGLHGFNWAPDGRLYMSQGDSRVQAGAPKPFRDLHGVDSDEPDNQPLNTVYTPETYEADYIDSWPGARQGGILRAGDKGQDLEIFSRGLRNPWDMTFDAGFNWLGADQDPGDAGDKVVMLFKEAHFGIGHSRGGSWVGEDNPAVVPPSYHFTRYQKNSFVGMDFYLHDHFPEEYRNAIFIGDWANRNIYVFRPEWEGALMKDAGSLEEFANGGTHSGNELRFTPAEGDPLFRPTDLVVGPEGALYVGGWGAQYGSRWAPMIDGDAEAREHWGRIFRMRHSERELTPRHAWHPSKRDKPHGNWAVEELIEDLGGQLPVWRMDAQDELVLRGTDVRPALLEALRSGELSEMAETYATWALGRMGGDGERFAAWARGDDGAGLNRRIQAIRIIGDRHMESGLPAVAGQLTDAEPRVRFAAAQALMNFGAGEDNEAWIGALVAALPEETDILCFYAKWNALRALAPSEELTSILRESQSVNVRGAALLALEGQATGDCGQMAALADVPGVGPAQLIIEQWTEENCN